LACKLENVAGYSRNQVLKILKTGITRQPVLDEIYPMPGSHVRDIDVAVRLVYQNMKYSELVSMVYTRSKIEFGFQIVAGAYSSSVTRAIWKSIRSRFH
jgi:hypothetical protein